MQSEENTLSAIAADSPVIWYLATMNDGLFVIDRKPRPAPVDYVNPNLEPPSVVQGGEVFTVAAPIAPSHAESNRAEAVRLLRELRETTDPDEIQRQKDSWADLEAALSPAAPAAPSPAEPRACVKCGHYRFRSQETGYCREVLNWYDDTLCGCKCEFPARRTSVEERNAAEPPKCTWKYDPDGYWQTSCGDQFCFTEGGPTENRVRFCHYCGKEVFESVYANGSGEGESE